ncbi:MAG: hypothetical protein ACLFV7_09825 [Phycisphaerae bacterium]
MTTPSAGDTRPSLHLRALTGWLLVGGFFLWGISVEVSWLGWLPYLTTAAAVLTVAGLLLWRQDVPRLATRMTVLTAVTVAAVVLRLLQNWGMLDPWNDWVGLAASAARAVVLLGVTGGMAKLTRYRHLRSLHRRWRLAWLAALVVNAGPIVLVLALLAASALLGRRLEWTFHGLHVIALTLLAMLLPLLLLLLATARTVARSNPTAPTLGRRALAKLASPAGMVVIALLWLTPVWLMLPVSWHFWTTPDFDAFVRANPGNAGLPAPPAEVRVVRSWDRDNTTRGTFLPRDEEGNLPEGIAEAVAEARAKITHGEELLAEVVFEVRAQFDVDSGEFRGERTSWAKKQFDRRFDLLARASYEPTWAPRELPNDDPNCPATLRRFTAVRLEVCLTSGGGGEYCTIRQVENLPQGYRELNSAEKEMNAAMRRALLAAAEGSSGWATPRPAGEPREEPSALPRPLRVERADLPGLLSMYDFPSPPPPGEGLVFRAVAEGCVVMDTRYVERTYYPGDETPVRRIEPLWRASPRNESFRSEANYDEYSYEIVVKLVGRSGYGPTTSTCTTRQSHQVERLLDGRVW